MDPVGGYWSIFFFLIPYQVKMCSRVSPWPCTSFLEAPKLRSRSALTILPRHLKHSWWAARLPALCHAAFNPSSCSGLLASFYRRGEWGRAIVLKVTEVMGGRVKIWTLAVQARILSLCTGQTRGRWESGWGWIRHKGVKDASVA